ncbi:Spy/CpxP family protein refolding chaperone [Flavobacterium sp.]|jgi:protein CpxP|uniref:Spy/CpxP family protein refolding chaperone n=1 Tax=Flavobacterium sp. TaxID=239 RepID=UPI0038FD1757
MDKIKLLTFSVIILLILNIVTLGFFIFSGNQSEGGFNGRPKPEKIIINKLDFDEQQVKAYKELIHWHRNNIDSLQEQIRDTKQRLYSELIKSEVDNKVKDSLVNKLANIQKEIENTHFKHFQDIKKLCKKEQLDRFNDLTNELSKIFSKPKPHDD